jgi:ADP-ribose pyrophosphatase YjhB (NUDIX family)
LAYNFCTVCGAHLKIAQPPTEDRPRLVCPECGYIQYINPKVVGGTLPVEDNRVWLLRRGIEPRLGYWTYPAGYQEADESTEQAAIRETQEEIGCSVEIDRLLGVYSRPTAQVVVIVYLAHFAANGSVPCLTTEALEVRSFGRDEIPWPDLAFPSTEQALRDWVELPAGDAGGHSP